MKKIFLLAIAMVALLVPMIAFAQDVAEFSWLEPLFNVVYGWIVANPKTAVVTIIFYFAGLVFKPLFSFVDAVVLATPSQSDDEFMQKLYKSPIYKIISYIIDLAVRFKLPTAKK